MWCGARGTLKGMPECWGFPLYRCSGSVCFRNANPVTQSAICGERGRQSQPPWGVDKHLLLLILTCTRENLRKEELGVMTSGLLSKSNVPFSGLCCNYKKRQLRTNISNAAGLPGLLQFFFTLVVKQLQPHVVCRIQQQWQNCWWGWHPYIGWRHHLHR